LKGKNVTTRERNYFQKGKLMIMRRTSILMTLAVLVLTGFGIVTGNVESEGVLRHVVSFKFKQSATPESIRSVENAFRKLEDQIPEILSFEMGINVSPEGLDKGFTHCFILTFKSEKDRDAYLVHPDHKAFGGLVGPVLDDVFVIDFWAR
jgi:hypothetical protein